MKIYLAGGIPVMNTTGRESFPINLKTGGDYFHFSLLN